MQVANVVYVRCMNMDERPSVASLTPEDLFREFLRSIDVDVDRQGLQDTPARVVRMYRELLTPVEFSATTFENDEGYSSMVTLRDIPFYSLCEHHLVPFFGTAHVGYLPNGRVLGLSKLARFVEGRARALQVQERMTSLIANDIEDVLHPRAIAVVIDARHLCVEMRGVRKVGAVTRTTDLRGEMLTNHALKDEFMQALNSK